MCEFNRGSTPICIFRDSVVGILLVRDEDLAHGTPSPGEHTPVSLVSEYHGSTMTVNQIGLFYLLIAVYLQHLQHRSVAPVLPSGQGSRRQHPSTSASRQPGRLSQTHLRNFSILLNASPKALGAMASSRPCLSRSRRSGSWCAVGAPCRCPRTPRQPPRTSRRCPSLSPPRAGVRCARARPGPLSTSRPANRAGWQCLESSTDTTVMPQVRVFSSRISLTSWSICARRVATSARANAAHRVT